MIRNTLSFAAIKIISHFQIFCDFGFSLFLSYCLECMFSFSKILFRIIDDFRVIKYSYVWNTFFLTKYGFCKTILSHFFVSFLMFQEGLKNVSFNLPRFQFIVYVDKKMQKSIPHTLAAKTSNTDLQVRTNL